jgi:hypothetical protein
MLQPILMSASSCNQDALVYCLGEIEYPPSQCGTAAWWDVPEGETPTAGRHYDPDDARRQRFNYLRVDMGTVPPTLADNTDAMPIMRATRRLENRVLAFVRGHMFPGGVHFDRLDNLMATFPIGSRNNGIGRWRRDWEGMGESVPGTVTRIRLPGSTQEAPAWLAVTGVFTSAYVIMQYLRPTMMGDTPEEQFTRYVEPLIGYLMAVRLDVQVSAPGFPAHPYADTRAWEYLDDEGHPVLPIPSVEWRGSLGGHTKPRSETYRTEFLSGSGIPLSTRVADALQNIELGGLPDRSGSDPDNPAHLYLGTIRVGVAA